MSINDNPTTEDLRKAKALAQATAKELDTADQGPPDNNIAIAREAIKLLGDLVYDPEIGFFYAYDGVVWKQIHNDHVFKACLDCTDMVRPGKNNESKAKTIMTRIQSMSLMERGRTMNDQKGTITVKNGKFCIDSLTLVDHDRNDYSTQLIDAELTKSDLWIMDRPGLLLLEPEERFPRFWGYLLDTFQGYAEPLKTIQYVQELFGYCLVSHCKAQKAFFLVGEGSDGKSVLCEILTSVVGPDNVSSLPFEALGGRFDGAVLKDKLANISADSNKVRYRDNKGTGLFKSIVSGDRISVEFKGRDRVDIVPTATMVMALNNMPEMSDNSHGWRRRINIMPFHNQVPPGKEDRDLADKIIKEEGPALFLFAMQGLQRLKERQWQFDPCQDSLDATAKYLKGNDPFTRFFNDHVIIQTKEGEDLSILVDDLFLKFNEWLDDNDMIMPRIDVYDIQKKAIYGTCVNKLVEGRSVYFEKKKKTKDGKRVFYYAGIDCQYGTETENQPEF